VNTVTGNSIAASNFVLLGIVCDVAKLVGLHVQILHLESHENALFGNWNPPKLCGAFLVLETPGKQICSS